MNREDLIKKENYLYEIPKSFRSDMRVPARIFTHEEMLRDIVNDRSLEQIVNVTTLPGIVGYALAMPDIHEGYGFPIGGVAAFDINEGIISPGGIGYDINCGVRLLRSNLTKEYAEPYLKDLGRTIFSEVPSGVGRGGKLDLSIDKLDEVFKRGAEYMVELGYGVDEDIENIESEGKLPDADPKKVSAHAKKRGRDQLGTMGSGNHFVEVQYVESIIDEEEAKRLNLEEGQLTVMIHTGSRGLGHQIATDYIKIMLQVMPKYNITIPDRELACAPFQSPEGQAYWGAMSAGANFAWANRQLITSEVRSAWKRVFGSAGGELSNVYDVAHNIAKVESYNIDGKEREVIVHRKGATRAFPNQPVFIPGSMGTYSYILVGQEKALTKSFGSSCHGAGRRMSRTQARKEITAKELRERMAKQGIVVNSGSNRGLTEEAPLAYKDVDAVVDVIDDSGIAKKVARLRPLAVIKG